MTHRERLNAAKRLLSEIYDDVPEVTDSCCQTNSDGYALVKGEYKLISMADFAHSSGSNLVSQIESLLHFAKGVSSTPPPAPTRREITTDEIMMMIPEENDDWQAFKQAKSPVGGLLIADDNSQSELPVAAEDECSQSESPVAAEVEDINEPYQSDITGSVYSTRSPKRKGMSKRFALMQKLARLEGVKTRNTAELSQIYKGLSIPQLYELITNAHSRGVVFATDSGLAALTIEEYRDLSQDKKRQYAAKVIEIFEDQKEENRMDMKSFARQYGIPYSTFVEYYKGTKANPYLTNRLQ